MFVLQHNSFLLKVQILMNSTISFCFMIQAFNATDLYFYHGSRNRFRQMSKQTSLRSTVGAYCMALSIQVTRFLLRVLTLKRKNSAAAHRLHSWQRHRAGSIIYAVGRYSCSVSIACAGRYIRHLSCMRKMRVRSSVVSSLFFAGMRNFTR